MGALVSRLDNRNPGYDVDPTESPGCIVTSDNSVVQKQRTKQTHNTVQSGTIPCRSSEQNNCSTHPSRSLLIRRVSAQDVSPLHLGCDRLAGRGTRTIKEYQGDFAFKESIQNMKLCAK
ncbi:hypothetical protein Bbelb_293080 [Branchiostoma belcheri]|nr:hypothetical protein Bbelb_293080 [Branchiostoma belcheri]